MAAKSYTSGEGVAREPNVHTFSTFLANAHFFRREGTEQTENNITIYLTRGKCNAALNPPTVILFDRDDSMLAGFVDVLIQHYIPQNPSVLHRVLEELEEL